jgi:hypothetical protein
MVLNLVPQGRASQRKGGDVSGIGEKGAAWISFKLRNQGSLKGILGLADRALKTALFLSIFT